MTSPRKKPSAGFWIVVAMVAVLVGYPLSFGPACWLTAGQHGRMTPYHPVMMVYVPIGMMIESDPNGEKWPSKILQRWAILMARKDLGVNVPTCWNGLRFWSYRDLR